MNRVYPGKIRNCDIPLTRVPDSLPIRYVLYVVKTHFLKRISLHDCTLGIQPQRAQLFNVSHHDINTPIKFAPENYTVILLRVYV